MDVKLRRRNQRIRRPTPTELVEHMLPELGPFVGDKAREYRYLGRELAAYLSFRGDVRGWDRLDVAQFVEAFRDTEKRIAVCCNLSALLCWLEHWRLPGVDLPALYDALLAVCPPDEQAHAYIRWGGELARGLDTEPPDAVLASRRRTAS